jgi:amidase
MRFHGADIIDPINVTNLNNINITTGLLPLFYYNFRHDISNYLSELKNTTMKSLKDLIEFNIQHADKEFHSEYCPDQNLFISSENQTNFTSNDYKILFNKTRQMNGKYGIDETLNRYKLDALIIPDPEHEIVYMSAYAGYPLIVVPLGFNKSNNGPYGLMFAASAWSEGMLLRIGHGFEQALPIRNTVRPKYAEKYGFILEFLFKIIELLKKFGIF